MPPKKVIKEINSSSSDENSELDNLDDISIDYSDSETEELSEGADVSESEVPAKKTKKKADKKSEKKTKSKGKATSKKTTPKKTTRKKTVEEPEFIERRVTEDTYFRNKSEPLPEIDPDTAIGDLDIKEILAYLVHLGDTNYNPALRGKAMGLYKYFTGTGNRQGRNNNNNNRRGGSKTNYPPRFNQRGRAGSKTRRGGSKTSATRR